MFSSRPVALITGASAGLGVDFARQLSARGHRLVLVARRLDPLEALAAELGNARAVAMDLAAPGAAPRLLADVAKAGEQVEILVNNAGFGLRGLVAELDAARQREMIDLNIGTLTDLCRAVAPQMVARRSGAILNVASTAAFQPGPGRTGSRSPRFARGRRARNSAALRALPATASTNCRWNPGRLSRRASRAWIATGPLSLQGRLTR